MKISELGEYDKRHKSGEILPKRNKTTYQIGWDGEKTISCYCPLKDCEFIKRLPWQAPEGLLNRAFILVGS